MVINTPSYSSVDLYKHLSNLFPLCRSITGSGLRQTLEYFESYHPELKRLTFQTGQQVCNWTIPEEWLINDGYLLHIESGQKFADFKDSNLHVLGYSAPVNDIFSLEELNDYIFTNPDSPDWIPYVTSYYRKRWGFCLSYNQLKTLPRGNYQAFIDSDHIDGTLDLSHAILKGESDKEIFFTSYVCHPSMANNELSGPVVLAGLLDYIKKQHPHSKYTYRFVFNPETIGALAYISSYQEQLKANVVCGLTLSCVGDEDSYSVIHTPSGDKSIDMILSSILIGKPNPKEYDYLARGSDERQYCSPAMDLPMGVFCRTRFSDYPEYHTSADNLSYVSSKGLNDSLSSLKLIVDCLELGGHPVVNTVGEPQLGRYGLYSTLSQYSSQNHFTSRSTDRCVLDVIAFCNGKRSVFEISLLTKLSLDFVYEIINILIEKDLVRIESCLL